MGLFSKSEKIEIILPYKIDMTILDLDLADDYIIDLEAYGNILGEYKYCYFALSVKSDVSDEIIDIIKKTQPKKIKIIATVKNNVVKKINIDLNFLAEELKDKRIEKADVVFCEMHEKSILENPLE